MENDSGHADLSLALDRDDDIDGRTLRRTRNIDAVLDAVISLAGDGEFDPTAEEIAARAGVSHRSIYRYFESRSDLLEAAIARSTEAIAPILFFDDIGVGPLEERIAKFVDARTATYWAYGPIARTAFGQQEETVRNGIEASRGMLRDQLVAQFDTEFSAMPDVDRRMAIGLVDAAFQFEAIEYLTVTAGLDRDELVVALTKHLRLHLSGSTN